MLWKPSIVTLAVLLCAAVPLRAQLIEVRADGVVSSVDPGFSIVAPTSIRDVSVGETMSISMRFNFQDTTMLSGSKVSTSLPMSITMDIGGRVSTGTGQVSLTVGSSTTGTVADAGYVFSQFATVHSGNNFPTSQSGALFQQAGKFEAISLFAGLPMVVLPDTISFLTSVAHTESFLSLLDVFGLSLGGQLSNTVLPMAYGVSNASPIGEVQALFFVRGSLTSVSMGIVPAPGGVVFGAVVLPWMSRRRRRV